LIRGSLGVLLIFLSLSFIFPASVQNTLGNAGQLAHPTMAPSNSYIPPCPCPAFNVTYAQFDLYTKQNATSPPSSLMFFSAINNTKDGKPVNDTAFRISIPTSSAVSQGINYTLSVPKGPGLTTFLKFDWNGTLGQGTSARYLVYNATKTPPSLVLNVTKVGPPYAFNFTGGPPISATGGVPVSCDPTDECYDVTSFIGTKLTLGFVFNSNATGKGLNLRVANIEIASVGTTPIEATAHTMKLNSLSQVSHNSTVTVTYNATATNAKHIWGQTVTTYYFPKSYKLTSISLNNTISLSLAHPIDQGVCSASSCSNLQLAALKNMQFMALNDTVIGSTAYPWFRGTAVLLAAGVSGEGFIQTTLGGVPSDFWVPGDTLQVRVNNTQGVNVTGSNIISILSPSAPLTNLTQTFPAPSRGIFLFNFTGVLPQAPLGSNWNVTSVFFNGFDYGIVFHLFRLEQVQVNKGSFAYSGNNRRLTASGSLFYGSNSTKPGSILGSVVAIDSGSAPSPLTASVHSSSLGKGMYISNVTLLNGAFTSGVSLIGTFTVLNPTGVNENATITLEHEWISQQSHGSSSAFSLPSGDFPFNPPDKAAVFVYKLNATLTLSGIRVVVTSLTSGNSITVNLPAGTPPVTSVRQHSGLFKITISSKTLSAPSPCASPACTNSIESPVYAYILVNPPLPGRLLASAPITIGAGGAFTSIITSGGELGARKLVFFVLGQDPNGVSITTQDKSTPESTILQATLDNVPTATQGQSITMTLHLQSNSTILNMDITVGLNVDGQLVQSKSNVSISHGSKTDVAFTFNAPSGLGVHTFTFFSPEYGAPLITGTLQVSVLQSSLQVIIPAIIGLAAAIVILLFFLLRKKPETIPDSSSKGKTAGGKATKPNPGTPTSKSLT
jgi:hypothetical protein